MSTFICENCGCIDNSACGGTYWTRWADFYDQYGDVTESNKKFFPPALCTECNDKPWHNRFPKEHWSKIGTKEELIAECKKQQGNYENAVAYFSSQVSSANDSCRLCGNPKIYKNDSIGPVCQKCAEGWRDPVQVKPKFPRNKPCPCGSGKKYKKCCIDKVISDEAI